MEKDFLGITQSASGLRDRYVPRLLTERSARNPRVNEWPGLWADVFVPSGLPWGRFAQSFAIHALVLTGLWGASRAWLLRPQIVPRPIFSKNDVIYFPASEYLPPIDTGARTPRAVQKGQPALSKQAILSVPPESDNRSQTLVTPPDIKLKNDVRLPNVVEWNSVTPAAPISAVNNLQLPPQQPATIIAPPPTVEPAADRRRLDVPSSAVIAPPPEIAAAASLHMVVTPESAIIEPPPRIEGHIRRVGNINIGKLEVVPPAPQLPLAEQRTFASRASGTTGELARSIVPPPPALHGSAFSGLRGRAGAVPSNVVPPPPSIPGGSGTSNRIVALGLHPVADAPPVAAGNRRGTFALSPNGKVNAPGTPDIEASTRSGDSRGGSGTGSQSDLPPGLLVKPGSESSPAGGSGSKSSASVGGGSAPSSSPATLMAESKPPLRITPGRRAIASTTEPTAEEREVFGNRKFYSMVLNMPNLNSMGGSWIIRFAELKDVTDSGDLSTPEPTRKVDPAYPMELMRTRIEGKVTLYAVIRADGTVGSVRVLSSVDSRLDEYARAALERWRFHPATKAGSAVDLEAVVTIPFRSRPAF